MKQILTLLLFTLTLFANIPPQITYNENHQPLVIEYEKHRGQVNVIVASIPCIKLKQK